MSLVRTNVSRAKVNRTKFFPPIFCCDEVEEEAKPIPTIQRKKELMHLLKRQKPLKKFSGFCAQRNFVGKDSNIFFILQQLATN